jgi:hypothetical protein
MVQLELFYDFRDAEDHEREPQCVPDSLCLEMYGEKMALTNSARAEISKRQIPSACSATGVGSSFCSRT